MSTRPPYILPLIVFSQFAGTSLWFVGNAILPDIQNQSNLGKHAIGNITSFVQFGFIAGTLVFAILAIADRYPPSKVFFVSSLLAAFANILITWYATNIYSLIILRFLTGFFLAGIYPVGMKIAADWYEKGLGKALGFLVGALVLGTAFPHLLKSLSAHIQWQKVVIYTSLFAASGGMLMVVFVKNGPYRKITTSFNPKIILTAFRVPEFRAAALGYFGHMWELYTFWAFVPVLLKINLGYRPTTELNTSLWSFIIIGAGSLSCIIGGYISQKAGSAKVAFYALLISGLCCCCSFFMFQAPNYIFLFFMLVWSIAVIADSPQFSALVAQAASPSWRGTALTFVTSAGFAITIASIQLLSYLLNKFTSPLIFTILAAGPLLGLLSLYRLIKRRA